MTGVVGINDGISFWRGRLSSQAMVPARASPPMSAAIDSVQSNIAHGFDGLRRSRQAWRPDRLRTVDTVLAHDYGPAFPAISRRTCFLRIKVMKVRNSIKSLAKRHRQNRVVRRRGRLYVINKTNRRFKARQG